ncbi:MAG: hybrid sensor histidine kinase/response regulator [Gemmatimonadota bacterium]
MTRRAILLAGLYAAGGGLVSLAGWVFDVQRLTDWYNNGISIQPNATLCATFSGFSLLAFAGGRARVSAACGSVVLLIGGLTLLQWLGGISLGIDDVLMLGHEWGRVGVVYPGRMGPPGSLSWTLIGTALVLTAAAGPGASRVASALGLATLAISMLSLIGYLYDVGQLYSLPYVTVIALQTATFVLSVSVGIVASHPASEPVRTLADPGGAGVMSRRALPLLVVIPVSLGFLRLKGQDAGLYDTRIGVALLVFALANFLSLVLWWSLRALKEREKREREATAQLAGALDELGSLTDTQRRERDFLQHLVEASPVAIAVVTGKDLRFTMLNSTYRAIAGTSVSPEIGRTYPDVFPEAAELGAAAELRKVIETGVPWKVRDFRTPIGNRDETWWEGEVLPLKSAGGDSGSALILTWEITERKEAEEAISQSEERHRSLVSVLTDVPWTTDAAGAFVTKQEAWSRYTGQTWEMLRGFGWADVIHPDDRQNVAALWKTARETGRVYNSTGRLWHAATREYRYFEARAIPLLDEDGALREWVGTCTDVHERVLAEQALREANERKDEFLALLAHELRNPLAPVRNAVQLLHLRGPAVPELEWARGVIDRQMQQMTRLIDDLLDVSRISKGKIELRRERADLATIIHGAVESSRPLIDQYGHDLTLTLPAPPVYLDADLTRLAQVFSNLLNNAAKYTDTGGRISLVAERQGSEVTITVTDTGIGIAPEMLSRVFEMFTQADLSVGKSRGGLGVGLTLVKRLVEMHGGRVEARSKGLGLGSQFVVFLPVAQELAQQPPAPGGELPGRPQRASQRVLVVDDNRDSADSLSMLLSTMGNEVQTGYDGLDAVRLAGEFRPDIALLDIGLPGMSGYEAARAIRGEPWGRNMVLVAVTGWGQESDQRRSKEAGFDHHLVKPVPPAVLIEMVAAVPGGSQRGE